MKKLTKDRVSYIVKRNIPLLITGMIPSCMGIICTQQGAKEFVKEIFPKHSFPFLYSNGWQFVIIVLVCIIIPIVTNIVVDSMELNKNNRIIKLYNNILGYLQDCVNQKKNRFYNVINSNYTSAQTIFHHITQPEKQLEVLCSGLCNVLLDYTDANKIKGTVIHCTNNKLHEFLAICGDDEASLTIQELNDYDTLAKHCISTKRPYVIENTEKCQHFYKNEGCNVKSAIGFPVLRGTDVSMVVCLTSRIENTFNKDNIEQYSTIFDYFGSRMILENYLYDLKKQANEKSNA